MRLLLMRHGIAEDAGPATGHRDAPRALTDEGAARIARQAVAMERLGLSAEVVLTSPLTRCRQTAELVCARLGGRPVVDDRLAPGMGLDELEDALARHPGAGSVLTCGHQPDLSGLVHDLTGGAVAAFGRGSLAVIDLEAPRPRGGRLRALYAPRLMLELAGPED